MSLDADLRRRDPAARSKALDIINGPDEWQAINVLTSIGFSEDLWWADQIAALLNADDGRASRAIWALGTLGADRYAEAVAAHLGTVDRGFYAPYALAMMGRREFIPRMAQLLGSEARDLRRGAREALNLLGAGEVTEDVFRLLDHSDAGIRRDAIEVAMVGRLASCYPAMLRLLDDPEAEVRIAAANACGDCGIRDAVPALRKVADDNSRPWLAANLALGRLGETTTPQLLRILENVKGRKDEASRLAMSRPGACDVALDACDAMAFVLDPGVVARLYETEVVENNVMLSEVLQRRGLEVKGTGMWSIGNTMRRGWRTTPRYLILDLCNAYGCCFVIDGNALRIAHRDEALVNWTRRLRG